MRRRSREWNRERTSSRSTRVRDTRDSEAARTMEPVSADRHVKGLRPGDRVPLPLFDPCLDCLTGHRQNAGEDPVKQPLTPTTCQGILDT
jgi:hypothetical protein